MTEEHIEFSCEKNVNNLTLEQAFENLALINNNVGQYGLSIEIDGEEYTKDSFDIYANISIVKDKYVEIGEGINAIKYYFDSEEGCEYYMFTYKDNIYNIKVPMNERINHEIQQFLDSLEKIK